MSNLFEKYPSYEALQNRTLFESGKLYSYLIKWNEDIDIGTDTIYEEGKTVRRVKPAPNVDVGESVSYARACCELSQKDLSVLTGID